MGDFVVIGDTMNNVTLRPAAPFDDQIHAQPAEGSFCVAGLKGGFTSFLASPQDFVHQLESMSRELAGEASLHGFDGEFSVDLKMNRLGSVSVDATFKDHQSFEAKIFFSVDQTYLSPIAASFRAIFQIH